MSQYSRPGAGPRVLIIDDDADLSHLYALVLEMHGYRVHTADDGPTGMAVARRLRPDLVLLDLEMPAPDGWEVIRLLRSDPAIAKIPVVAFTGRLLDAEGQQALLRAGFDHYLPKPRCAVALIGALQRMIPRPQTPRSHPTESP